MHLYLDCDGVLADFEGFVYQKFGTNPRAFETLVGTSEFWKQMQKCEVFRNLAPMPDAHILVEYTLPMKPVILTGTPWGNWAKEQKLEWRDKYFPELELICCPSKNKKDYCKPGDILIDDWQKYRHLWIKAGGTFISHYDAESSILALEAHLDLIGDRG